MPAHIRYTLVIALAGVGFLPFSQAQTDHSTHGMPTAKPAMAMTQTAMEQGVLRKVNKATGKVSIAHEAQQGGMPAMTMVYNVKNLATLDKVQTGQKVRFTTDPADGNSLVHLEPMK